MLLITTLNISPCSDVVVNNNNNNKHIYTAAAGLNSTKSSLVERFRCEDDELSALAAQDEQTTVEGRNKTRR